MQLAWTFRPSLYVAFFEAYRFKPLRGKCFRGINMSKSEQYNQMERSGLKTAQWHLIQQGQRYDPKAWGAYAIVKPDVGRKGIDVKIRKTGRIRYEKDCADNKPHLIQPLQLLERQLLYFQIQYYLEHLLMQKDLNLNN